MRQLLCGLSTLLLAVAFAGGVNAQAWPAKSVRLVVPYPPGGSNDVLSRITAQAMSPGLGQQIVIDNRSGAGGMIGADNVAKSPPDGYSLVNVQASFTANAALRTKMAYDPLQDFAYLGMMARGPLLTPEDLPVQVVSPSPAGADMTRHISLTQESVDAEKRAISAALGRHGGNRTRAAMELGISRTTLWRKITMYNLL